MAANLESEFNMTPNILPLHQLLPLLSTALIPGAILWHNFFKDMVLELPYQVQLGYAFIFTCSGLFFWFVRWYDQLDEKRIQRSKRDFRCHG